MKLTGVERRALVAVVALTRTAPDAWAFSRDVCDRTGQHVRGCAVTLASLHVKGLLDRKAVGHAYAYRPAAVVVEALRGPRP